MGDQNITAPEKLKVRIDGSGGWGQATFSIMKAAFLIFLAVFIWVKGEAWIDKMFAPETPAITEATIERIAENMILVQNQKSEERFEALLKEMKKQQAEYINASDRKFQSALEAALEYAKKNDAEITALGQTVSEMNTSFKETVASITYKDEEKPSRSYEDYDLEREMVDGSNLPVGWVKYHPEWEGDDKLVQYFYPLEYHLDIVRSQKDDGTFAYHTEAWVENNFVPRSKGIKYPLDLDKVRFEERPLTDKSWSFNPRLSLGMGATTDAFYPNLGVSLFSYGTTNSDMTWRFLTLGMGASGFSDDADTVGIMSFTPASYNLGKSVPLVENFFIGPVISVNTDGDTGFGIDFSVPF